MGGDMENQNQKQVETRDTISFVRFPIFKKNRQLWGYRVRCIDRQGDAGHRLPGGGDVSALVSSNSCMGLERLLSKGKCLMVDLGQKSILKAIPYVLPPENSVIRISETIPMDASMMTALEGLKSDGYRLAVSRFSGEKKLSNLYRFADILCLRTSGKSRDALSILADAANPFHSKLLGEQVRDAVHFDRCSDLGFSLFQGSFFKKPEKISVRKISSNEAARFKLMKIIEEDAPDLENLTETIQSDVTISLRLLTYLNSAAFGFRSKINSIQQAITLLGWENMKKWLRVVVLSDVSKHTYAQDLVLLSSQRGKFLETLVQDHDYWGFSPDSMFLLGVFSLLDALLGMPMEKVVLHLPLEETLKAALRRDVGSEYTPFLNLVECFEDADWDEADRMIQQLSMDGDKVKGAFHSAVEWANELDCLHT
jgi:EAL and modified HD-GYP domain-containing signal transduction protein